ncbi:hypothetical protein [Nocardia otitidiscaviarum]|uniref:hypothetical protein n=1 Tax=Nocardia otitidiscaviarum TaxID=1823 RepID=UPI0006938877|nr:hypothetical protein [Nocardia otitidiscaviarum]
MAVAWGTRRVDAITATDIEELTHRIAAGARIRRNTRGGALALRVRDLDTGECLLRLREKGGTLRWQPISPLLAAALADHAAHRGARRPGTDLLRYRDGRPLTYRRYDQLWTRIGTRLPWVAAQGVSTHWLSHTTLTWVERHFGYGTARAYAGHRHHRCGHHDLHQSRYPGGRHRPGRHDRPTPPARTLTRRPHADGHRVQLAMTTPARGHRKYWSINSIHLASAFSPQECQDFVGGTPLGRTQPDGLCSDRPDNAAV